MSTRSLLISAVPFRLAPLCISLLWAAQAQAEQVPEPSLLELPPLVVTWVVQSSPVTVVTDPKQPRQPVPAADGADYLKTIPGFNAIRSGGTNGDPLFRGMFGSRLNILSDGGLLLGACPNRMDAPTSYLSPENFDRLTVLKGPQTVLCWPAAARVIYGCSATQLRPMITGTVMVIRCRRAGKSGTAMCCSAGHPMTTP